MRSIELREGIRVYVDQEDYALLCAHAWYLQPRRDGKGYYVARTRVDNGKRTTSFLHREILGAGKGVEVDHRDGDGLNNVKANLRAATHAENMGNRRRNANNTSGFKGVSAKKGRWLARLAGKDIGLFDSPEEASEAYKKAAEKKYGEFARFE